MRKELVLAVFLVFSVSVVLGQSGWNKEKSTYVCEGSTCVENDSFVLETLNADGEKVVHMDSGSTGFCGTAYIWKEFSVPEEAQYVNFGLKAREGSWADAKKVFVNGEEVLELEVEDPEAKVYEWRTISQRIEDDSVNITVSFTDDSRKWCNNFDHTTEIYLHNVTFSQEVLNLEDYPDIGPEPYPENTENREFRRPAEPVEPGAFEHPDQDYTESLDWLELIPLVFQLL